MAHATAHATRGAAHLEVVANRTAAGGGAALDYLPRVTGRRRGGAGCALHIVFADRKGRRKLRNIVDLVAACNRWKLPPPHGHLAVNCSAHDFGVGLIASLPTLWRADVLVVSHGADILARARTLTLTLTLTLPSPRSSRMAPTSSTASRCTRVPLSWR